MFLRVHNLDCCCSWLLLIVKFFFYYLSTMAQLQAFNQALLRCGFNGDTAAAIVAEGFDTLDVLASMVPDDIDAMLLSPS
jgi:hypothetical protein